jgi:hypothetical protein
MYFGENSIRIKMKCDKCGHIVNANAKDAEKAKVKTLPHIDCGGKLDFMS